MKKKIKSISANELDYPNNKNKSKLVIIEDFQVGKIKTENMEKSLPKNFKIHPYPIF